ncbi:hypothetical protein ACFPRL_03915 [Pseudoclavibacter helvolus]
MRNGRNSRVSTQLAAPVRRVVGVESSAGAPTAHILSGGRDGISLDAWFRSTVGYAAGSSKSPRNSGIVVSSPRIFASGRMYAPGSVAAVSET